MPSILDGLDDVTYQWRFNIIGEGRVIGNVVDYRIRPDNTPITITVKTLEGKVVEIPWASIQTIEVEGE